MPNRRVALVCSEPMGLTMAGIGLRYLSLATALIGAGFDVRIFAPPREGEPRPAACVTPYSTQSVLAFVGPHGDVVVQGHLGASVLTHLGEEARVVVDLYDPWIVEHLSYHRDEFVMQDDRSQLDEQLLRGDFFMVGNPAQRLFFVALLYANGRVDPAVYKRDPTLRSTIDEVPFMVAEPSTDYAPVFPARETPKVLFGGIYDWLDPKTALRAAMLATEPWQLLFMNSPNASSTPQDIAWEARRWTIESGLKSDRVYFSDWIPAARRFDLIRDCAVMLVLHQEGLEADLSLRTRVIEAVACGVPVITTRGGRASTLVEEFNVGIVVEPGDALGTNQAISEAINNPQRFEPGRQGFLAPFSPDRAVKPLVDFLSGTKS